MNMKPRTQKLIAEINITPFTDVILVLLIIFMIITPLIFQSRIQIQLPQAAHGDPSENSQRQSHITLTSEGLIYLENVLVTRKELQEQMNAISRKNPSQEVFLLSDKDVRFRDIVEVMDTLKGLGITKLSLTTSTNRNPQP